MGEYTRTSHNWTVRRILVAECKQEVASFNPVASRYGDFAVRRGAEIADYHRSVREEVGGALAAFAGDGSCRPVLTYSAVANTSGGTLEAAGFRRIAGEFLSSVRAAGAVDGAYFALHGAMSAEGEDDPEGFLLRECRKILGECVPFVVSLDLHGILTDRMIRHSDAIVAFHTYPHVDFFETGQRAARILLGILGGRVRPITARVKVPALVRGDELVTATGFFGRVIDEAKAVEADSRGLSGAVLIGNPFTDVPALRSNALTVTDGDRHLAVRAAKRLARRMWSRRRRMQASLVSVAEAVRLAARTAGRAVLMDAADAPSSGATGDSVAIVREASRCGYAGRVLAPVVDPGAVQRSLAAGVGGTVRTTVGGALDPGRFRPLAVEATVRMLSDGSFRSETFRSHWCAGLTAVLEWRRTTLVVTSRPVSLYDRSLFLAHGLDPRDFDLVVVKSPHCEPQMYSQWCARLVNVDGPGSTSGNLRSLGHVKCPRPVFPLDDDTPFDPEVTVYQRSRYA